MSLRAATQSRTVLRISVFMIVVGGLAHAARAETCGPAVILRGDPALVAELGELLVSRGIALDPADCPAVEAHVARSGQELTIDLVELDGTTVARTASEAPTAATVIESFVRADVGSPLLAVHTVPAAPEPALAIRTEHAGPGLAPHLTDHGRGLHLFGAFETSYASDNTSWLGAHVGACILLGPVCAAARARFAAVATGPGVWQDQIERRSVELLVGLDVPLAIGGIALSPGFAGGLGQMHTRGAMHERAETGGMRAEVHATLSIPLSHRLALDVFAAADLTQETHVELGDSWEASAADMVLPAEPRVIVRGGVGVRYGGL